MKIIGKVNLDTLAVGLYSGIVFIQMYLFFPSNLAAFIVTNKMTSYFCVGYVKNMSIRLLKLDHYFPNICTHKPTASYFCNIVLIGISGIAEGVLFSLIGCGIYLIVGLVLGLKVGLETDLGVIILTGMCVCFAVRGAGYGIVVSFLITDA